MKTFSLVTAGLGLLLAGGVAQAAIVLDGAALTSTDPTSGSYNGIGEFSTTGCCSGASLYVGPVAPGHLLSTTPSAAPDGGYQDLAYSLPNGTTSFVLESSFAWSPTNATDLFFNMPFGSGIVASQRPSITAYLDASNTLSSGIAGSTQPNWGYYTNATALGYSQVANGGLSFTGGGQTVTLSNYASGVDPSNSLNFASFDLTVTSAGSSGVPEPGTVWFMLGAGGGLLALRRRSRQA